MIKVVKQYCIVIIGLLMMAISFNLFQAPYNFAPGGVSGLGIIVHHLFSVDESIFIFGMSLILIIVSMLLLGKEKTKNTILGSILFPIFIFATGPLTTQISFQELDLIIVAILGGALSGLGLGLIYKNGFTSGGTDIINQILEQYCKIPLGRSLLIIDGSIVCLTAIVFGIPAMVYSLIMLIIMSIISNKTFLELDQNKVFYIYTEKPNEVKKYLTDEFAYDLTIFDTIGGFTQEHKKLFMCSVHTHDYYAIKEGILLIDPHAFMVIANAYEQKNANVLLRKKKKTNTRSDKVLKRLE